MNERYKSSVLTGVKRKNNLSTSESCPAQACPYISADDSSGEPVSKGYSDLQTHAQDEKKEIIW